LALSYLQQGPDGAVQYNILYSTVLTALLTWLPWGVNSVRSHLVYVLLLPAFILWVSIGQAERLRGEAYDREYIPYAFVWPLHFGHTCAVHYLLARRTGFSFASLATVVTCRCHPLAEKPASTAVWARGLSSWAGHTWTAAAFVSCLKSVQPVPRYLPSCLISADTKSRPRTRTWYGVSE
jgi:hypothetical protein